MDLTARQLQPLLRELGKPDATSVTEMKGGSSRTWRIDLPDGERLVFKAYADAARWRDGKEAFAAAQVKDLPVPITRYLMIDDSLSRLPYTFAITNYLPGVTLQSLAGHPDIHSAFRQAGALLRQLHEVRMPGYGAFAVDGIIQPKATNGEFARGKADVAFERFRHYGASLVLADRLQAIVEERFGAIVPHSRGPVFAHDDLHPNNVLVVETAEGRLSLSGLIDFGNAQAADAVWDLAKCLFCSEHDISGCQPHILAGYGPIDHPDPAAALCYYTLLHRVTMWCWLRHVGVIATSDTPSELIDDLRQMASA
jgi:aminoglycoside phosphotransferase (APT) family kinase protein